MFSGHYETPTPDMYKAVLRDNESLRHDIERHIAIASELATENERLRTTIERLREALESIAGGEIYPVQAALDALMAEVGGEAK